MKQLYLDAISGMNGIERFSLNFLIVITVLAVVISTAAVIASNWRYFAARITFKTERVILYLSKLESRISQYNEKNDEDLKSCVEQWWDETKAARTKIPTIGEVIAYQLRGSIR